MEMDEGYSSTAPASMLFCFYVSSQKDAEKLGREDQAAAQQGVVCGPSPKKMKDKGQVTQPKKAACIKAG
eukprot:1162065-Pelagomonas_calceolata.AAC.8